MGKRRTYAKEFKERAVRLWAESGKSAEETGEDLGVKGYLIRRWKAEAAKAEEAGLKAFPGQGKPRDEELHELRKRVAELEEANEILKKAAAIFAAGRLR
jgi:transposase